MASRADDKRALVLSVAAELFEARGYRGTTVDDVAAGVKLNKGTLYHYFPSKSSMLRQIYSEAQDLVMDAIEEIGTDSPPDEAIRDLIRFQLRAFAERPHETAVYFQEMRFLPEWLPDDEYRALRSKERIFEKFVTDLITRGIDEGKFAKTDAKVAAFGIIGMSAWTHQWFDPGGSSKPDEIADTLADIALRGLSDGAAST